MDITLVTLHIFSKVNDWIVSDKPSLSDHAMITFHFTKARSADHWYRNVRKANWKDYKKVLPVKIRELLPLVEIRSIQELDTIAEGITKSIINA